MVNSLFYRLLRSNLLVLLTTIFVTGAALSYLYSESVYTAKEQELVEHGSRLARYVESGMPILLLRARVEDVALTIGANITIANRQNLVTLTTLEGSSEQALRLSPEDVAHVLQKGEVVTRRGFEEAIQEAVVTAIVPIRGLDGIAGAVVLHAPIRDAARTIASARRLLFWAAILAGSAGIAVSYVLSRRITKPIREMTEASLEMAQGNFEQRVSVEGLEGEIGALGRAFNALASQLGETIRALTHEKNKTGSILASMDEGVVAVDSEGVLLLVNPAMTKLFGINPECVGTPLRDVASLRPLWSHFSATLQGDQTTTPTEIRVDDKVLALHMAPLTDERGQVEGAVAILHDVTERYRLERMRRDFLANVSHELRTPLTSIRGFAQAILEGMVINEEQTQRYLQVIMDESLRLTRLVNTVLDLSRIESNAIKLQFEQVDLAEVISDVVESLEPICKERRIRIATELERLPHIQADPDWIAQVFVNLLENAVRHSPAGGLITVRAAVEGVEGRESIVVDIEDEGSGIPEEDLPFIWERFYKVDKSRRFQQGVGTGLGLVIVKELVSLHGGTVSAANRPERGARFRVVLPVS